MHLQALLTRILHGTPKAPRRPGQRHKACPMRDDSSEALSIGHPLLDEHEARGHITSLGEYINEGALFAMHANAGQVPYLIFHTPAGHHTGLRTQQDSSTSTSTSTSKAESCGCGDTLRMEIIYRANSQCRSSGGLCNVEIHSGWLSLNPDTAVYWQCQERMN